MDLEGRELDRWGGCGQGPGEFSGYFWGIWGWRSDSLLVADGLPGRLSIYSSGGELGRLTTLTHLDDLPLARPIGPVGDRLLMRYDDPGPFLTPGLHRQELVMATTDLAGRDVERVGTFVSRTYETIAFSDRLGARQQQA